MNEQTFKELLDSDQPMTETEASGFLKHIRKEIFTFFDRTKLVDSFKEIVDSTPQFTWLRDRDRELVSAARPSFRLKYVWQNFSLDELEKLKECSSPSKVIEYKSSLASKYVIDKFVRRMIDAYKSRDAEYFKETLPPDEDLVGNYLSSIFIMRTTEELDGAINLALFA